MTAPTDLQRSIPFTVTRAEEDEGDGLTLDGYAAVFGSRTLIDSWEGTFYEQIRKGAFRKTLRERTPVVQFDHGRHPLIGSIPIGGIRELREDDQGLFISSRLSDNWLIQPVRDAIADGAVTGMSFRFGVVREEWRDKNGKLVKNSDELMDLLWSPGDRGPLERTLIEVRMPELGPVVFPAYDDTSVGVRARSVADEIAGDNELLRKARADLALETSVVPADEDMSDPDLRREVACALLFGSHEDAPLEKHPSDFRSTGAPLYEHPPAETDAPPEGHPSPSEPSMSTPRLQSELARLNGLIDIAERSALT